ncbi:hypothetical protein G5C51_38170 [Streptomyces sp. A7024]|uniref:Uncharacterized protein n=1 Tax=Streptomyces coryli TaxID=1128680 RepID=A0A6G4UEE6_9ACTN|nr:hypothetical protein [Streptomyces coryli]NGN69701.1 hypothetical protein [Streptomyces coryli]
MAHNPQGQAPGPMDDPAGNTQMFRAFVDEGAPQQRGAVVQESSGSRVGLIVGVLAVVVVLAGAAWLALS